MLSEEIIRQLREDHAEADQELVQVLFCNFDSVQSSVCSISLAQALTICNTGV